MVVLGVGGDDFEAQVFAQKGDVGLVLLFFVAPFVAEPADALIPHGGTSEDAEVEGFAADDVEFEKEPALLLDDFQSATLAVDPVAGEWFGFAFDDAAEPRNALGAQALGDGKIGGRVLGLRTLDQAFAPGGFRPFLAEGDPVSLDGF